MSIEWIRAPRTSDGETHADLNAAKYHELSLLLATSGDAATNHTMIMQMVEKSEQVISILRATGRKPRQRKVKVVRARRSKVFVNPNGNEEAPA